MNMSITQPFRSSGQLLLAVGLLLLLHPVKLAADGDHIWSGKYFGAALQFSSANSYVLGNRFTYDSGSSANIVDHDMNGAGLQVFLGQNYQNGSFVSGFEASLAFADLASHRTFNADNDIDKVHFRLNAAVTGRLGYASGQSLFYGKAGIALTDISNVGGDVDGGNLDLRDAHIKHRFTPGLIVGIGYERALNNNFRLRIEYTHSDYKTFNQHNLQSVNQIYNIDNGPIKTISLGIVKKF